MMDDEVVCVGGVKRGRTDGTSKPSILVQDDDESGVKSILGTLPRTLGEGEHERSIMEGILVALRDLSMDVQDLKGAIYMSWEMDRDSQYITDAVKMKESYSEDCRNAKGKGI